MDRYDYIIVGAGPAGCVLAHRLSADENKRVLLLESGPGDWHPFIHMPRGIGRILANPAFTWVFDIYRSEGANAPSSVWTRGRTLGGSSSVNGQLYIRGEPADYDALAAETSEDWNWAHIGKAFKAIEHHDLPPNETRGDKGPLRVTSYHHGGPAEPLLKASIEAAEALGMPYREDVNTPDNAEKIGYGMRTIYKGRRQSAAVAFLKPIRHRKNLTVRTNMLVDRVLFDGDRAIGVMALANGAPQRFEGAKVIICGGTLASPAILQRSGIGPAALLTSLGVPVVADRPQVGENLREHFSLMMQYRMKNSSSNNALQGGLGLIWSVLRYYLTRTGVLTNAAIEVTGFLKSNPGAERANGQVLVAAHSLDFTKTYMDVERAPGFMISSYPLKPRARGTIQIQSKDPKVLPRVVHSFLSDPDDVRERLELIRFVRKMVATEPLAHFVEAETRPGAQFQTDEELIEAITPLARPAYHAAGTCRMGADPDAVVDPQTRVRGVQNLHVVDLSIAPFVLAGNTNGPTTALAWRAADLIMAQN